MTIDTKGLSLLIQEASTLSRKANWTKHEERRNAFLLSAIAAVKAGATLAEVDQDELNTRERAAGLPLTTLAAQETKEEREARAWKGFVNGEKRDMTVGGSLAGQLGTYTGLGYFVPTDFFPTLFRALKAHDALFDEENVTLIKSANGRPLPIPVAGDTEHTASVVAEAASESSVDFDSTDHVVLGAYTYMSDRYVVSMEAFQDLSSALTVTALAKEFFQDKLARGIGADLVNGTGEGVKPLGLIPALYALGVVPVNAEGSEANDGMGTNNGVNSLGSIDFSNALAELDEAYASSPKCAWIMNKKTLVGLHFVVTKTGQPLDLVKYIDGVPTIYGIPVKICPSMDSVGASAVPVILGDFRYWATRLITADEAIGLKVYTEAPGLIEKGNIGIRCFTRADGALLWTDTNSPCPFVMIRNAS